MQSTTSGILFFFSTARNWIHSTLGFKFSFSPTSSTTPSLVPIPFWGAGGLRSMAQMVQVSSHNFLFWTGKNQRQNPPFAYLLIGLSAYLPQFPGIAACGYFAMSTRSRPWKIKHGLQSTGNDSG